MPRLPKIPRFPALFAALAIAAASLHAECPQLDFKTKADTTAAIRILRSASAIDDACLRSIAAVTAKAGNSSITDQFLRLTTEYSGKQGFPLSLLCRLVDQGLPQETAGKLLVIWEQRNGSVPELAGKLDHSGDFAAEDSLLAVAERCRPLGVDQLLQWAHARELQGKINGSFEVYCRVLQTDPHRFGPMTWQMQQLLEPASEDSIVAALGILRHALSYHGIDTVPIQYWIADFYRRHGLDSLEQELLFSVPATVPRLLPRAAEAARLMFSQGSYEKAILPARSFYDHTDDRQAKAAMADILYQSFQALHRDDSALVWLLRAGISGNKRVVDAAVLFQRNGKLREAQSVIATLDRSSFGRDTFAVRQKLFCGDTAGAIGLIKQGSPWDGHPDDRLLWTARILLFEGEIDQLTALLDSVPGPSDGPGSTELLNYRLVLQKYKGESAWLHDWGLVHYSLFLGKPIEAYDRISGRKYTPDQQDALLLCIAKALAERGSNEAALRIFEQQGDSAATPEYLYSHAELLQKCRQGQKSKELLMKIIRDYPGTIFSEKARVLLAALQSAG